MTKWDNQTGEHIYSFGLHDTHGNTTYTPGLAQRSGGADRYFLHDQLGSTRYLTNAQAGVTSGLRYDAYGNRTAQAGPAYPTGNRSGGGLPPGCGSALG